jgi:hypothetical protein
MNHGIYGGFLGPTFSPDWEERKHKIKDDGWGLMAPDDPLRLAIEESARCREIEALRVHLAHSLRGIFDDQLEAQHSRLLALPERQMRTRKQHFAEFKAFCHEEGLPSLPTVPEAVAHFLVDRAAKDIKAKALEQIVESIRWVHALADMGQRRLPGYCDFDAPIIRAALVWVQQIWDDDDARIAQAAAKQTTTTSKQPKRKGNTL